MATVCELRRQLKEENEKLKEENRQLSLELDQYHDWIHDLVGDDDEYRRESIELIQKMINNGGISKGIREERAIAEAE